MTDDRQIRMTDGELLCHNVGWLDSTIQRLWDILTSLDNITRQSHHHVSKDTLHMLDAAHSAVSDAQSAMRMEYLNSDQKRRHPKGDDSEPAY